MNSSFLLLVRMLCALVLWTVATDQALAERRVALVVGNGKYDHAGVLANTLNDADAIAGLLTKAGFDVVDERRDVGVVEFKRAVREFMNSAAEADVAVVYYSGHGIEINGVNYLVPVDAKLVNDDDVEDEAISLNRIITATQSAKTLSLIILDACRNSPFTRSQTHKAPAPIETPTSDAAATRSMGAPLGGITQPGGNTLVAYAAKAGSVSYDGAGPNSPFTTALLKYIAEPGVDVRIALGKVRDDVMASTDNRQEPFVYGSLGGAGVSLVPKVADPAPMNPAGAIDGSQAVSAADYAMAERVGTRWGWVAFLAAHGTGFYSNLARAQLAKLISAEPSVASNANGPTQPEVRSATLQAPAPPAKIVAPQPQSTQVASLSPAQAQTPAPSPEVAPVVASTAEASASCKAEAEQLKTLRLSQDPAQVAKFARELTCPSLRLELSRLMESLGVDASALPAVTAAAPRLSASDMAAACKHDALELSRNRANLSKDAAAALAHDLKCEQLRPQVARLLESVGD